MIHISLLFKTNFIASHLAKMIPSVNISVLNVLHQPPYKAPLILYTTNFIAFTHPVTHVHNMFILCLCLPGWLYEATHSYDVSFYVAGAWILFSGLALFPVPKLFITQDSGPAV